MRSTFSYVAALLPCLLASAAFLTAWNCGIEASAAEPGDPPPIRREFRAAWVATVANIDWPSKPGLPVEQQREELIAILDSCQQLNLNAVVLQVRPSCDALYASELEPWSKYLTGEMGKAPEPYYDPLEFAVEEAHQRGLELHVWFNPYRALHADATGEIADNHISQTQPEVVKEYGKYLWLDPGEPAATEHTLAVIMDVVNRYDVDGVHMDDYFYPYPITDDDDEVVPFPDDASWQRAVEAGTELDRDDWRRQNVNDLVKRIHEEIRSAKPWVQFGISPFGIWRPGHPPQIKGFDQYASLYADAKLWLESGWVDYFTPQLYWKIGPPAQSYPALLNWWHEQNKEGRHLWPGNYTSRLNSRSTDWAADEIVAQIWCTRAQEGASGNVHFSMKALQRNAAGIADALVQGPYQQPALVPESPWMEDPHHQEPPTPNASLRRRSGAWVVSLEHDGQEAPWQWVIHTLYDGKWTAEIISGSQKQHRLPRAQNGRAAEPDAVAVSSVNRIGRTSSLSWAKRSSR